MLSDRTRENHGIHRIYGKGRGGEFHHRGTETQRNGEGTGELGEELTQCGDEGVALFLGADGDAEGVV